MRFFQVDAGKEWRGGQRQSLLLAKEIQRKGYPLEFIVQPNSPLHEKALEANLSVSPLKIRNEFDFMAALNLARVMKKKNCVLVHFHDAHSLSAGSIAASLAKVPIRVISRRVDFSLNKNPLSQRKYKKAVDSIIAVSSGVKKVLIESGIDARVIDVVPDGIDFLPPEDIKKSDFLRKELSLASDDYLVGIVAHLADHKGHKYLIEATKILKDKAPKIKIIIVGEGSLLMNLTRQAKEGHIIDMAFFNQAG